jgi:nucleoid DNA-binding protein
VFLGKPLRISKKRQQRAEYLLDEPKAVAAPGSDTFKTSGRKARTGRNPNADEQIMIKDVPTGLFLWILINLYCR